MNFYERYAIQTGADYRGPKEEGNDPIDRYLAHRIDMYKLIDEILAERKKKQEDKDILDTILEEFGKTSEIVLRQILDKAIDDILKDFR